MYWSRLNPRCEFLDVFLNGSRVSLAHEASDHAGWVSRLQTLSDGTIAVDEIGRAKTVTEWGKVEIRPVHP